MENRYASRLVRTFFESNFSKELQSTFQQWFVSDESIGEKRDEMRHIWDSLDVGANESTIVELNRLKKRIKAHESTTRKSLYIRFSRIAVILLLPLLGAFLAYFLKKESITVIEPQLTEHFVPYGEREKILLPDSSEVWLNSGSLLVYEKNFTGESRSVYLMGEASFDVRKKTIPFIVKTKEINIEVLGTVFNVESYMNDPYLITTLEEGKVKINTNETESEPVFLSPNEQLIFNKESKTIEKKTIEAAKRSLWKQGHLVFQNSDFSYIMKTIERRFNVKINYLPNSFEGRFFTVKFSPEENLTQILDLLTKICGFNYNIEGNTIQITN